MKEQRKKLLIMTLMCSLISMICLTGCDSVKLYPLEGRHIVAVKEGEQVTAPADGYFLSNDYFKKILKAEVKEF